MNKKFAAATALIGLLLLLAGCTGPTQGGMRGRAQQGGPAGRPSIAVQDLEIEQPEEEQQPETIGEEPVSLVERISTGTGAPATTLSASDLLIEEAADEQQLETTGEEAPSIG